MRTKDVMLFAKDISRGEARLKIKKIRKEVWELRVNYNHSFTKNRTFRYFNFLSALAEAKTICYEAWWVHNGPLPH